jgi:hypothetical protein
MGFSESNRESGSLMAAGSDLGNTFRQYFTNPMTEETTSIRNLASNSVSEENNNTKGSTVHPDSTQKKVTAVPP